MKKVYSTSKLIISEKVVYIVGASNDNSLGMVDWFHKMICYFHQKSVLSVGHLKTIFPHDIHEAVAFSNQFQRFSHTISSKQAKI